MWSNGNTGNDKIQARGLYKEPFNLLHNLNWHVCVIITKYHSNDDGT